jgi:undecaprenyl diphosphate synthase
MVQRSIYEEYPILKTISPERFPSNIFIIPDGNGRWAKKQNLPVRAGHEAGFHVIEKILSAFSEIQQIHAIGFWGFAADNWKRSAEEIDGLTHIFSYVLRRYIKRIKKRKSVFVHLGRKDRLPKKLIRQIETAEEETSKNSGQSIYTALDFGGEDQTLRMLQQAQSFPKKITEENVWELRDGKGKIRAADLIIRTSGEKRTSDVGWLNGSPTELYFIEKYFPDITVADIIAAIVDFSKRERRFGGR